MNDGFVKCRAVLGRELEALVEAGAAAELVAEAVKRREWADFDGRISAMNEIGARIAGYEEARSALMPGVNGSTGAFYQFVRRFPDEERRVLCDLYRQVRLEAARVRFRAAALASYLSEARALVSGILEAAFPEKRGKIYGKTGAERNANFGGIVLDRRF
ncbi:MAG: hypothetical protein LBO04_04295 [Spirochaetaceae bacterium]|nr:hypothetical protein [Spirochaetaceae bacterium]